MLCFELIEVHGCRLTYALKLAVPNLYLTSFTKSEPLEPSHECIQHGLIQLSVRLKSRMIVQALGKICVPSCQHAQLKNWPELFGEAAMCFSKCQEFSTRFGQTKITEQLNQSECKSLADHSNS